MATSRNDIFSTSWRSPDTLVPMPAPALPATDLARRRTTGPAWRRPRTIPPRIDSIFPSISADISCFAPDTPHGLYRGGSLREPPTLRVQTELPDNTTPSPSQSSSRTSSFFDRSPNSGLCAPSTSSTRSVSTSSHTGSSTNPSLAAPLPSPAQSKLSPLVQLRFGPRPELELGRGRFSKVYLAAYRSPPGTQDWRVCVVKRLEPDEDSQALGLREAWFLRQLRVPADGSRPHPGQEYITKLLSVEVEENEASLPNPHTHARSLSDSYAIDSRRDTSHRRIPTTPRTLLVLDYYPLTLSALLHAPHKYLLTPRTFLSLATQLSQALAHCHTHHILHTDLKPANVLLAFVPGCGGISVRLGDFGSALHLPSLPSRPTDPVGLGTLSYSPPEFFRPPPSPFSFPADMFSAGVTLSAALFSREPYARLGPRACRQWVTRGAYWTYEESERVEAGTSAEVGERVEWMAGVGTDAFEKVLERPCTPVELASLIPPSAPPPPSILTIMDTEPYADGSAATYFPGVDEQTNARKRVPQEIMSLLKHMCEPIPEMRPSIEEVMHKFESLSLGL